MSEVLWFLRNLGTGIIRLVNVFDDVCFWSVLVVFVHWLTHFLNLITKGTVPELSCAQTANKLIVQSSEREM